MGKRELKEKHKFMDNIVELTMGGTPKIWRAIIHGGSHIIFLFVSFFFFLYFSRVLFSFPFIIRILFALRFFLFLFEQHKKIYNDVWWWLWLWLYKRGHDDDDDDYYFGDDASLQDEN